MIVQHIVPKDKADALPIWAWCNYSKDDEKPPFDEMTSYLKQNELGVIIELNVPIDCVLLSDFYDWHCVLNAGLCTNDKNEYHDVSKLTVEEQQQKIEDSWQRIFLPIEDSEDNKQRSIQATLPYIDKNWIVSVVNFTGTTNSTST